MSKKSDLQKHTRLRQNADTPWSDGLDEMQRQKRDRIGAHMFKILLIALCANIALHAMEITWMEHPLNVIIIISVSVDIYLAWLILNNAYWHGTAERVGLLVFGFFFAVVFVATATNYSSLIAGTDSELYSLIPRLFNGFELYEASDIVMSLLLLSGASILPSVMMLAKIVVSTVTNKDEED